MRVSMSPSAVERRFRYFPRLRVPLLSGSFFALCAILAAARGDRSLTLVSLAVLIVPLGALLLIALSRKRTVDIAADHIAIPRILRLDVIVPFDQIVSVDDNDGRLDIEDANGRRHVVLGDWLRSDTDFAELAALVKERKVKMGRPT